MHVSVRQSSPTRGFGWFGGNLFGTSSPAIKSSEVMFSTTILGHCKNKSKVELFIFTCGYEVCFSCFEPSDDCNKERSFLLLIANLTNM